MPISINNVSISLFKSFVCGLMYNVIFCLCSFLFGLLYIIVSCQNGILSLVYNLLYNMDFVLWFVVFDIL